MKRIGLTQRAHLIPGIAERRDMLDQRWARLIERLGGCPVPLANTVLDPGRYLDALGIEGLLMTGGNDITSLSEATDPSPERDNFEAEAYAYSRKNSLPVLGVCRGAQMINLICGGELERITNHIALRHEIIWNDVLPCGWYCPPDVNSYHGWAIPRDGLATGLTAAGWASDGSIEAFYCVNASITGIVWHPEREETLPDEALTFLARTLGLDVDAAKIESRE